MSGMLLEVWSVEDLKPYEKNVKVHSPEQVEKIAESIKNFGWDQPIVVDKDGVIIKGHGRRLAAMKLGIDEVPVLVRSDLSDAEVKAARIADNRVALGEVDTELLSKELSELFKSSDFTLESMGFDEGEITFDLGEQGEFSNLDSDDLADLVDETESRAPELAREKSLGSEQKEASYHQAYQVVVECDSEADQETVYNIMSEKGYRCRVLSM